MADEVSNPILKVISENESLRQQLQSAQQQYERIWKKRDSWQERAEKAEAELASLKAAGEGWIPCAELDKLPQMGEKVLIWRPDYKRRIVAHRISISLTWTWTDDEYFYSQEAVTHHHPLPPAPAKPAEGPAAKEKP